MFKKLTCWHERKCLILQVSTESKSLQKKGGEGGGRKTPFPSAWIPSLCFLSALVILKLNISFRFRSLFTTSTYVSGITLSTSGCPPKTAANPHSLSKADSEANLYYFTKGQYSVRASQAVGAAVKWSPSPWLSFAWAVQYVSPVSLLKPGISSQQCSEQGLRGD